MAQKDSASTTQRNSTAIRWRWRAAQ